MPIIPVWWAWVGETDRARPASRRLRRAAHRGPVGPGVEAGGGADQSCLDERAEPAAVPPRSGRPAAGRADGGGPGRRRPVRVGVELVDAHFTEVAALQQNLAVLGAELVDGAAARPGGAERISEVLGGLAAGYAQALQDRTRGEQEQITAAAFAARVAAEQARWNSEARLEAVFAESVIGIAIAEIDGRIPGGQPSAVRDARLHRRGNHRAHRSGRSCTPTTPRGSGNGSRTCWPARPTTCGWKSLTTARTARRSGLTWCCPWSGTRRAGRGTSWRWSRTSPSATTCRPDLQHQALHDPLTGLPNRTVFFHRLDAALQAGPTRRRVLPGPRRLQGHQRHPRP